MLSRSTTLGLSGHASARRRQRRRTSHATQAADLYCRTNGCTTHLRVDPETGVATCPICGYSRRLH